MNVLHSPEQLMHWKPADLATLIDKHVTVSEAADQRYWQSPTNYTGAWTTMAAGTVTSVRMDEQHPWAPEWAEVAFAEGCRARWLAGQAVRVEVSR